MKPVDTTSLPLTGIHLIEASAGTGKTYTITTLFLRLLIERRLPIQSILVVTFTNAATAELRDRIRRRIRQAIEAFSTPAWRGDETLRTLTRSVADSAEALRLLEDALRNVDRAAIFTIHGFCQRALLDYAFESGTRFDLELVADARRLIAEIAHDYWQRELIDAPPERVRYLRARGISASSLANLARIAVSWPDMPLAFQPDSVDPDASLREFYRARRAAARAWPGARNEVARALVTSPALNRSHYSTGSVQRWLDQLASLLETNPDSLEGWFDEVRKFSTSEIIRSTKKGCRAPLQPFFELCDALVAAYDDTARAHDAWILALQGRLLSYARTEFARRKRTLAVQTFDDLLHQLRNALRGATGESLAAKLRGDLPAALIDEFHDTDPVQYEIFRRIYSRGVESLFLIGDPKQAIYAFRGADVYAYLEAVHDTPNRWTLGTNYRSDPSLVRAVNAIFSLSERPFAFEEIPFHPVAPRPDARDQLEPRGDARTPLEIVFVPGDQSTGRRRSSANADRIPRLVTSEIATLLASGTRLSGRAVQPGDIAVLTRSNREARDVQTALQAAGIVSVLHGDSSVFDTVEAQEMGFVLRALAEPSNAFAIRSALATTLFGLDAGELFRLRDDAVWERWVGDFHRWHALWERHGFVQCFRRMLRDQRAPARLLGEPGGERKLTNVNHLVELIHQEAATRQLRIPGVLQWFDDVRFNDAGREGSLAPEAQQIRLESDDAAVQITTMHRSKGLEYPVVYCPYLWRGWLLFTSDQESLRYHDPEDSNRLKLDLRPRQDKQTALAAAEREALAENLRLAYVALTRAKHHCVVFWGAFRGAETSPLGYLLHPPDPGAGAFSTASAPRIHSMEDADLRADLGRIVKASNGTISVRVATEEEAPPYRPASPPSRRLESRPLLRSVSSAFRVSSFSALAAGASTPIDSREGRDIDESAGVDAETAEAETAVPIRLHAFPRGAASGDLLHEIFERVDFGAVHSSESQDLVRETLDAHGFDAESWSPVLLQALSDIVRTPFEEQGLCLADVPKSRRLNELEFTFPVGGSFPKKPTLSPGTLGRIFFEHAPAALTPGYAQRVENLGFYPMTGFLRGYIDLLFEHEGRFFLVDYKSNFLGPLPSDYTSSRLAVAMGHHHYFLQYHIYTVAVHRYLKSRIPNYDYEHHFGGVFYLFVRGMAPDAPGRSVFFDQPTRDLVETLSAVLDGVESST